MTTKAKSKETSKEALYPIKHWSHSSMMQFLRNRLIWKQKYILMVYDYTRGVSATVGSAGHHALNVYYGGDDEHIVPNNHEEAAAIAIQAGLEWLDRQPDHLIDYGKTGTREKMLQIYNDAIRAYLSEVPDYAELLVVEDKLSSHITTPDGRELALPAVGKPDLVIRNKAGEVVIIDHKFVSRYSDPDAENAAKFLQSMFYYFLVKNAIGEEPKRMIFRECKTSKNRDGSPQVREWGVEYDQVPHYFDVFYTLYDMCTKEIGRPDVAFLPNFSDMFDGDDSFVLLTQGLLGLDMSDLEIDHSTSHVKYMHKEKRFIGSQLDAPSAKGYTPEEKIKIKLAEFGVPVKPQETNIGPSVIQYTFTPSSGVSVKRIKGHAQDIAVALGVEQVRIVAPIPGTSNIGVEVPRNDREIQPFTDSHLEHDTLMLPIGIDAYGELIKKDLTEMPHLLVAGATGAGKSVFINAMIRALTEQNGPDKLKLRLIDPKRVELVHWSHLPHLDGTAPIYDPEQSLVLLNQMVVTMEARYEELKNARCRDIKAYHKVGGVMPYMVVVIDEFADLMAQAKIQDRRAKLDITVNQMSKDMLREYAMSNGMSPFGNKTELLARARQHEAKLNEHKQMTTEEAVVRLAQMARAVGIHLIIGTQRPSVDVITGVIKANIPTRAAFMTSSQIDSVVILDQPGAEQLVGKGDMLFLDPSKRGLQRLQGLFTE